MKAKKAKKPSRFHSFNSIDSHKTSRAVLGLLIIMLAASVFLLFRTYEQSIVERNMFYPFIILTFLGMGLLLSLLFLSNPSHPKKK